jgi:hypothetical protein
MARKDASPRFGPGHWVTLRDSGEHVRIEVWSTIAAAYRVRSRRRGVFMATGEELDEVAPHPEEHLGRHWRSCVAPGCGAPLTPNLPRCARCHEATCACGRCACVRRSTVRRRTTRAATASRPGAKVG